MQINATNEFSTSKSFFHIQIALSWNIDMFGGVMTESRLAPKTSTSSHAGRWYLIFLGLAVALIGGLFVFLMGRSFLRAREMRNWPETPCVIISSEIRERQHDENSPREFQANLSFGYEWQGQPRTGDRLTLRGNPWSSKRKLAEERAAAYPLGKQTTCRVSPENPDFAVLKTDSLAPGYSIWFPALFVVGGLGITIRAALKK
ncbi:MAG: DUF3592 domain-containing protein [Akkermansiaceae bacterium]|nr:DUF3592 domain-containing protein [Akkermansiaceae bacterium]